MRITQLRLENFKSFKEPTTFDFAPITLLFGPNSAGKSSIIQAIDSMSFWSSKNEDFSSYFHHGSRQMTVGLTIDVNDQELLECDSARLLNQYQELFELGGVNASNIEFGFFTSLIKTVGLSVTWHNFSTENIVEESLFTISINNQDLLTFENTNILALSLFDEANSFVDKLDVAELRRLAELDGWTLKKFNNNHSIFDDKDAEGIFSYIDDSLNNKLNSSELFFAFSGLSPSKDMHLDFSETSWSEEVKYSFEKKLITAFLQLIITAPFEFIDKSISASKHLGPLRVVPDFQSVTQEFKEYDGSLAWDLLGSQYHNRDFLPSINKWLSDEDCLASGYQAIVNEQFLNIQEADSNILYSPSGQQIERNDFHEMDILEAQAETMVEFGFTSGKTKEQILRKMEGKAKWKKLEKEIKQNRDFRSSSRFSGLRPITFRNVHNSHITQARNIGVGISQVLPVIVYAHDKNTSFLSIEQPELHLHPRMQAPLSDLFISQSISFNIDDSTTKKTFLIETHSEHIVLRLLRRIREETLKPEDVSILYIQNNDGCSVVKQLRIDEEGDFLDEWPDGFFDERDEELF